ncbi:suppressor protein SRP40-like isoform X1 [Miscanthus floridulus]|uniref:suppressor protein SRP40-like isoform X1 n=1 Tax=Miscanthus floridulus TaxID=154761 RepID=UPI00345AFEC6
MVEDKNSSQDTVQKSGHIVLQNVSYDKDVVKIKLADDIDSDNYGDNFVKDVCVDEGALLHRMTSEEKPLDRRSSPNFSCQMIDADGDIRYGKKDYSRISVHELKPEVVSGVDFAPHCDNEKQHSSRKEYDLEDRIDTGFVAGNPSEKKISLQELLLLESAEESRHSSTMNSESSERHKCPLHEEAIGQTSKDGDPDVQTILANTSEYVSSGISSKENASGCPATTPGDHDTATALDVREPQKIDRHNPFVDHRSLEDTSVPECSIPGITDAASTDSICSIHIVTGGTGLDEVKTSEQGADTLSTSSSEIQSSEKSNDHSESIFSKAIAGAADETTVATSSTPNSAEHSDAYGKNQEKHDQIDEEHSICTDDAASKSSTLAQDGSVVQQTVPGSSKSTARIGNENTYEQNFSGPSIMSGPVSMSGHITYSGSISLRSDSSTTSTRSFAFPVLQRERISSPVRMAKAERRRSRRHRVWRKGIICCKF